MRPVFTLQGVGRRSRTLKARREEQAIQTASPVKERAAGRDQAYHDAYQQAQERALERRQRPRGPWRQRGARIVRAAVTDHEWDQLAKLAADHEQPASIYLGQLIRAHLDNQARS